MLLRDWRSQRDLSLSQLAERVRQATGGKTNAAVVGRWDRHEELPRKAEMRALYLLTVGQVTPNDFYELPALPEAERAAA